MASPAHAFLTLAGSSVYFPFAIPAATIRGRQIHAVKFPALGQPGPSLDYGMTQAAHECESGCRWTQKQLSLEQAEKALAEIVETSASCFHVCCLIHTHFLQ
ncbi:UNVERIFIED_CONTAM: hypothetical protein K2H54_042356 [Gekko kuhli]